MNDSETTGIDTSLSDTQKLRLAAFCGDMNSRRLVPVCRSDCCGKCYDSDGKNCDKGLLAVDPSVELDVAPWSLERFLKGLSAFGEWTMFLASLAAAKAAFRNSCCERTQRVSWEGYDPIACEHGGFSLRDCHSKRDRIKDALDVASRFEDCPCAKHQEDCFHVAGVPTWAGAAAWAASREIVCTDTGAVGSNVAFEGITHCAKIIGDNAVRAAMSSRLLKLSLVE